MLTWLTIDQVNGQIVTDRPDQTESSSVVPKGSLQIESGILLGYEGGLEDRSRQILLPTNLFRYGISKDFELRLVSEIELNQAIRGSVDGITDLQIGTKIQLLRPNENRNIEIALLSHLIVPSGSQGLSSGNYGTINKLSIAHELSDRVGLGYNIGYDNFGEGNGDFTYSLALGASVNDHIGIYVEPFGAYSNFDTFILSFDTGFTYLPNENLQLDFSFGTGINHKMNYVSVGASILLLQE